jgi:1-deoxy-D-xylulose-5-phosphate synthase
MLAFGSMVAPAMKAAERLDATVADMRFVKPLDEALISALTAGHSILVTIEEACLMGGAGAAVLESLAINGIEMPVLCLGLPDVFINHGDRTVLLAELGLDADGIVQSIRRRFAAFFPENFF